MALDWSKDISPSGLKKSKSKGGSQYPTKTHMNLAVADKRTIEVRKALPVGILLLVVVVLFAKFGVYDFVDRVNKKGAELAQQEQILAGYAAQLADYDEVLAEYQSYEANDIMNDGSLVGALDALRLVSDIVEPVARVSTFDCEGGVISLTLSDVSLDATGSLVNALYEQPEVAGVTVGSASTGQAGSGDTTTVSMTIALAETTGGDE